ncbi:hypothetical protein AAE478_004302 [Parahypoxylon ruwenzoriense]
MAKERADKPRKEKPGKTEKISKDKVKKHKKEKKSKRTSTPDGSDEEPSKLPESPAVAEEEPSAEPPVADTKPEKEKRKAEKAEKRAKKDEKAAKKKKKTKEAALEAAVAEDATSDAVQLPVRPVSRSSDPGSDGGAPLFAIDTNPTPVDPNALATAGDPDPSDSDSDPDAAAGKDGPGHTKPPSGLNRTARRRIRMVEAQRERIQKDLGVSGPRERADEVQALLDKWTADFDGRAAIRLEKKQARRQREAARIKSKRGKTLAGRRLKERTKQLQKMDKKASKKHAARNGPAEA